MTDSRNPYRGHRFPREVIAHAVRLYLRFALSFRDVEELLAERGVAVSYETVRRWVAKFGGQYADELRRREARRGRTWHLDEMGVRVGGRLHWLWRAVDEHGQTLDVLLQAHRDTAAAERFFRRLLDAAGGVPPERITTDKLGSYSAAVARFPELVGVEHQQVRSALRCNNRVEQAHQPTRVRERVMRRFKSPVAAQRFLEAFTRVGNLFRPGRHRLAAETYRATMRERGATWRRRSARRLTHSATVRRARCGREPPRRRERDNTDARHHARCRDRRARTPRGRAAGVRAALGRGATVTARRLRRRVRRIGPAPVQGTHRSAAPASARRACARRTGRA